MQHRLLRSIHATTYQISWIVSICKFVKRSTKSLCVTSPYPCENFIPLVSGPLRELENSFSEPRRREGETARAFSTKREIVCPYFSKWLCLLTGRTFQISRTGWSSEECEMRALQQYDIKYTSAEIKGWFIFYSPIIFQILHISWCAYHNFKRNIA